MQSLVPQRNTQPSTVDTINGIPIQTLEITTPAVRNPGVTVELVPVVVMEVTA